MTDFSCHGDIAEKITEVLPNTVKSTTQLNNRAGNISSDIICGSGKIEGQILCYRCKDRLNHNVLLPDGTVLLCCMDYSMKHILGNLNISSYDEILNSDIINLIRDKMRYRDSDILCRQCVNAKNISEIYDLFYDYYNWANELFLDNQMLKNKMKGL